MLLDFQLTKKTIVAGISISTLITGFCIYQQSTSAQPDNSDRWYANLECRNLSGLAAAKVSQLVVNSTVDPSDAVGGFVAHPLWIGTGSGSWVEVGYDREPFSDPNTRYYWASYTPTSDTYVVGGYPQINTYKELKIAWDRNSRLWNFHFGGQLIGRAANVGGPVNSGTEAGLESTSPKNVSAPAPVYGLQYATLSNFTWRDCANPVLYQNSPARIYWVNRPFSAETRLP